jgi:hypothetical protein
LMQTFGLTAERLAERVLDLDAKKRGKQLPSENLDVSLAVVECSRCHTLVPFYEYLAECPVPSDGICADCERRSEENCAACQLAWMRSNPNFRHLCRDCRDAVVSC